ncbi:MAG: sensor histidine kinase [Cyanosarcina radialis HA8281-LM2]|nr:sensor histidine kinase [Cyanosarcina radialis HA8281-LM2]
MPPPFLSGANSRESLSGSFWRAFGTSRNRSPDRSFRLILYLEWILLGLTFLLQIRPARFGIDATDRLLVILILIGFGLMGLKLPTGKTSHKVLYTALEIGLLVLTFLLDRRTGFFPLLGLIIAIRSCLIFQPTGRLIAAGLVFALSALMVFEGRPYRLPRHRPGIPSESIANTILTLHLNTAIGFGLTLLFILLLVNALLAERESREKLLLANERLRQYAIQVQDRATLQERNRIAREIHDALGHALTAQSIQLENALLFLPPEAERSKSFLQESQRLGASALQEVRRSIVTLRSNPLEGKSLENAIAELTADFQTMTAITPDLTLQISPSMPTEIATALYRILQEALTNIAKHSAATEVEIGLQESRETIQLQIADNGRGFEPNQNTTGFGLQGIRERTVALGGQFFLTSHPGRGCRLTVSIPLPRQL